MDSVTQFVLGASVGEATLGQKVGKKAPLWGAALGTLPDLDVLVNPFVSEMQALAIHRGLTHSLFFVVLATPIIGYTLAWLHRGDDATGWDWSRLVGLALGTHVLLDCFTAYGTQVFSPFSDYPVIFGTIFVIDPLYTLPLILGLLGTLRLPPTARARRWMNYTGLALSTGYLLLTVANKLHMNATFAEALHRQEQPAARLFTRPMPLQNVLWMGIAEDTSSFWIGYQSLLDEQSGIAFRRVPKHHDLLAGHWTDPAVQRLRWFSRGYFAVSRRNGALFVHDLRFGRADLGLTRDAPYIFTFRLLRGPDGRFTGFHQTNPRFQFTEQLLRRYWMRITGTAPIPAPRRTNAR